MNVLVLRPERAAVRTAQALHAMGHAAILAPVLSIEDLASPIPDGPFDAVLATSANGLRKLWARPEIETLARLPLIAVGDRTAAAGREAGFATVHVAEGDGRALVAEAAARFPKTSRFLHAAGADRAFDVAGALERHGHRVEVVELYRAAAVSVMPPQAVDALGAGKIGAVLHHSRRIAETFMSLSEAEGLLDIVRTLPHAALALRVAEPLHAAGCPRIAVAEQPDEGSLFAALDRLIGDGSQSGPLRSK